MHLFSPPPFPLIILTKISLDLQTISHRVCICLELLLVSLDLRERVLDPVHAALDLVVHPRDLPLQDVVVRILASVAYLGKKDLEGRRDDKGTHLLITVGAWVDIGLL